MARIAAGALALLLGLSVATARESATPKEQYKAILKEYQVASTGAKSDEERKKLIAELDKRRDNISRKFLELAKSHPKDSIAVDALIQAVWMVNHNPYPTGGKDGPGNKAMALLLRDHVKSDKIGPICQRITTAFRSEHDTFLRTVLKQSPHKNVQALACLSLAQFLNNRAQRLDKVKERPALARKYEGLFGKEYLKELQGQDRTKVAKEIEALLERAAKDYGNEKVPYAGTVGEKAKAELFELRNLFVGQEAPDIKGEDQDGKSFKLSDYRGKVVLLDFWHQY